MIQIKKLIETKSWWFWILVALAFKSILLIYYVHNIDPRLVEQGYPGLWGGFGGDTRTYIKPIENLLANGSYVPNDRMPGYGIVYIMFRFFMNGVHALNALILLQVIVSSISVYALGVTAERIFKSKEVFYYAFVLYLFSELAFSWDYLILTESFTLSALVLSTMFFTLYFDDPKRPGYMVLSGLFLTWAVFLKPIYGLVFAIVGVVILIRLYREKSKALLLGLFAFAIPFVLVDGAWIVRNYTIYQQIIPLTPHLYLDNLNNSYNAVLIQFMQSWGGDIGWDVGTDSRWFCPRMNNATCMPCAQELEKNAKVTLPDYIYTSKFNKDSLIAMRADMNIWDSLFDNHADPVAIKNLKTNIEYRLNIYTQSVKTENPFLYYVKSRLVNLRRFIMGRSITTPLIFHPYNKLKLGIYALSQALYYFALFSALIVAFVMVFRGVFLVNTQYALIAVSLILLYGVFIFPFLKLSEHRYLAPEYPFIVLCSTAFFIKLKEVAATFKGKKK